MTERNDFAAWFLGPKAENADFTEKLILFLLRDYTHWRRNYFPSDGIAISKKTRRENTELYDNFEGKVSELAALLRRNFPFYSPRYIGHQLSEVLLPSLLGTFAGMLYNPNNVTPEAAPVTVDLEISACNKILTMLGYSTPPEPPDNQRGIDQYERTLRDEFGWAHITSGGTAANIEALWVARNVRYFPLSVKDAAKETNVSLEVKLPDGKTKKCISECTLHELVNLRPNESIYLLARFIKKLKARHGLSTSEATAQAMSQLKASDYSLTSGFSRAASEFPPAILVSGAAHYSVSKAANLLGIGSDRVILVNTDSMFRMDISDLRLKLKAVLEQGMVPLAVIGIAGTTEEGAVDPIHLISDVRDEFESQNTSFWLHVDAAWAGYFRTLFVPTKMQAATTLLRRVGEKLDTPFLGNLTEWHHRVLGYDSKASDSTSNAKIEHLADWLENKLHSEAEPEKYFRKLYDSITKHSPLPIAKSLSRMDFKLTIEDRNQILQNYMSEEITLERGSYSKSLEIMYGAEDVTSAFLALPLADSITVDPHKMGFQGYPCGVVAFKNDRVRHFVMEKAPYITAQSHTALVHHPPRHLVKFSGLKPTVSTDAFAPFILEGSRPGSVAAGLWLSTQLIPLDMTGHGDIIRSSVLAARELYEWLIHWDKIARSNEEDNDFEFVPFTPFTPDTNIVIFAVKKKVSRSLKSLNDATMDVYEKFTIQAELGERQYSYSQPFFLSRTTFQPPNYPHSSLEAFLQRLEIRNHRADYAELGINVLRATVMNPFCSPINKDERRSLMREFVEELASAASGT